MADIETQVALVQRDIENFSAIFSRLDLAIEKIGVVSTDLTRMLAVHEERISAQDRNHDTLKANTAIAIKEINDRVKENITDHNKEITEHLNNTEMRLSKQIKGLDDYLESTSDRHDLIEKKMEERINALERWRWTIAGGAAIVGFVITFIFDKFFYLLNGTHVTKP